MPALIVLEEALSKNAFRHLALKGFGRLTAEASQKLKGIGDHTLEDVLVHLLDELKTGAGIAEYVRAYFGHQYTQDQALECIADAQELDYLAIETVKEQLRNHHCFKATSLEQVGELYKTLHELKYTLANAKVRDFDLTRVIVEGI